ncbi:protein of unknown function [Lactiplantibacillus plantarum]
MHHAHAHKNDFSSTRITGLTKAVFLFTQTTLYLV